MDVVGWTHVPQVINSNSSVVRAILSIANASTVTIDLSLHLDHTLFSKALNENI